VELYQRLLESVDIWHLLEFLLWELQIILQISKILWLLGLLGFGLLLLT
jgi:hypothetical protein